MTRDEFWQLIGSVDQQALAEGDEDGAIDPLEKRLESFDVRGLEAFEEHLSQVLYALDGEVYADQAGEAGDSDDGFLYVRCFVVARGREHYEATLKDPALIPETLDEWCEALLYPHRRAWAKITGSDESEWTYDASVSYESGSNEALWRR